MNEAENEIQALLQTFSFKIEIFKDFKALNFVK